MTAAIAGKIAQPHIACYAQGWRQRGSRHAFQCIALLCSQQASRRKNISQSDRSASLTDPCTASCLPLCLPRPSAPRACLPRRCRAATVAPSSTVACTLRTAAGPQRRRHLASQSGMAAAWHQSACLTEPRPASCLPLSPPDGRAAVCASAALLPRRSNCSKSSAELLASAPRKLPPLPACIVALSASPESWSLAAPPTRLNSASFMPFV